MQSLFIMQTKVCDYTKWIGFLMRSGSPKLQLSFNNIYVMSDLRSKDRDSKYIHHSEFLTDTSGRFAAFFIPLLQDCNHLVMN